MFGVVVFLFVVMRKIDLISVVIFHFWGFSPISFYHHRFFVRPIINLTIDCKNKLCIKWAVSVEIGLIEAWFFFVEAKAFQRSAYQFNFFPRIFIRNSKLLYFLLLSFFPSFLCESHYFSIQQSGRRYRRNIEMEVKKVCNATARLFKQSAIFVYSLWVTKEMRYQTEVFIRNCLSILAANSKWNVLILVVVFLFLLLLRF